MPERVSAWWAEALTIIGLVAFGIIFGAGQILSSGKPATTPMFIGHCICMGGLTMAAGAVLVWVPDVPLLGLFGVAGVLATLGAKGLEGVFTRWLGNGSGGPKP